MESYHAATAVILASVFMVLACISVALRQYAQSLKGNPFSLDALFMLAALVSLISFSQFYFLTDMSRSLQ